MSTATQTKPYAAADSIDEQSVIDYLQQHPEFFQSKDELLASMTLSHETGKAVSLLERQLDLLKDRNLDLHQRLNELLKRAAENDALFTKTKKLIVDLIRCASLDELSAQLVKALQSDFNIDHCAFIVLRDKEISTKSTTRFASHTEANDAIGSILTASKTVCGALRSNELAFLFQSEQVGSAAVTTLQDNDKLTAILAVGSNDALYFRSSMDTLFINHIADVVSQLLPDLLNKQLKA